MVKVHTKKKFLLNFYLNEEIEFDRTPKFFFNVAFINGVQLLNTGTKGLDSVPFCVKL